VGNQGQAVFDYFTAKAPKLNIIQFSEGLAHFPTGRREVGSAQAHAPL
jgi:hypothetical protein